MIRALTVIGLFVWALCVTGPALAADEGTGTPREREWYVGLYGVGVLPVPQDLRVDGIDVSGSKLRQGYGGGLKAGVFPAFAGGILGVEAELFGHSGKVSATPSASSGTGRITNLNAMVNLVARYPGERFQPYVGAGVGVSGSRFSDVALSVSNGATTVSGEASDTTVAYQAFAGARVLLSERVYLFGEYKFFGANYTYHSDAVTHPVTKLGVQTHLVAVGLGLAF